MTLTNWSSWLTGLEPSPAAVKPWWRELRQEGARTTPPLSPRPIWTAEAREDHRALPGSEVRPASFYRQATFYGRLDELLEIAQRHELPLAVVVLQLPELMLHERLHQGRLEMAVRREVRCDDLVTRLSPSALAVALPWTGPGAESVALRLQRVLFGPAGGRVMAETACLPVDGHTAGELLHAATWRSLATTPAPRPSSELTRLLGAPSGMYPPPE